MKTAIVVGILLIVLRAVSLAYQGISYMHQKKVVDLGPIHANETVKSGFRCLRFWVESPWWGA